MVLLAKLEALTHDWAQARSSPAPLTSQSLAGLSISACIWLCHSPDAAFYWQTTRPHAVTRPSSVPPSCIPGLTRLITGLSGKGEAPQSVFEKPEVLSQSRGMILSASQREIFAKEETNLAKLPCFIYLLCIVFRESVCEHGGGEREKERGRENLTHAPCSKPRDRDLS